jgi:hypothetical protein
MKKNYKKSFIITKENLHRIEFLPFNRKIKIRKDLLAKMNKYGFNGTILVIETKLFGGKSRIFVLDGQHRLHCAMFLNIPVKAEFAVYEPTSIADLVTFVASLNTTQKPWTVEDFVDTYCYLNLQDYVQLSTIKAETPYSMNAVASLLAGVRSRAGMSSRIKDGVFKITQLENAKKSLQFMSKLSKYGPISSTMMVSIGYVFSLKGFNEKAFIEQYKKQYECIKELNLDDYTDIFLSWL